MKLTIGPLAFVTLPALLAGQDAVNERRFLQLVEKVENDAIELARHVESLYRDRCQLSLLGECIQGNYDHCSSLYPGQTCPGGDDLNSPVCGDGVTCSTLYSFDVSSVSLPASAADGPNGNPTDPQVVETICFSRALDDYLRQKRLDDAPFWAELGFQPNYIYFGSHTGTMRLSPATHFDSCGSFDPRVRPWYLAASSGPKNIIMVLDTSGSMLQNDRIGILKQAAIQVVKSATIGDRIAVVPFATEAEPLTDEGGVMYIGNEESKASLITGIEGIEAKGGTVFINAFKEAFSILEASIREEVAVNCNTVLLFLTDGLMTPAPGITEEDVIDVVKNGIDETSARTGSPTYLFTYSISGGDQDINRFPKALACAVNNGVWSDIATDEDILDSLASYYTFFALGLGTGANEDFAAWVEPYRYIPGDTLGTTVSAPVYDRSKNPHLFLGVVGIDFTLAALDAALGVTTSEESFRRIVRRSTARCPRLEFSTCELESYRRQSNVGNEGLCTSNCTLADFVQIEEEKCPGISDYPANLWQNNDLQGVEYTKKACCEVGRTEAIETCQAGQIEANEPSSSTQTVVIAIFACLAAVLAVAVVTLWWIRARNKTKSKANRNDSSGGLHGGDESIQASSTGVDSSRSANAAPRPWIPSASEGDSSSAPAVAKNSALFKSQCQGVNEPHEIEPAIVHAEEVQIAAHNCDI